MVHVENELLQMSPADSESFVAVPPVAPIAPLETPPCGLPGTPAASPAEGRLSAISDLLTALEEAAEESGLRPRTAQADGPRQTQENQLAAVRSGVANSLFRALRRKHSPTASHSLRVALGCSAWALHAGLDEKTLDVLELAALMHEVGKIGVPDAILYKPGRLTDDERRLVRTAPSMGEEILAGCCTSAELLRAVRCAGYRYDGEGNADPLVGEAIPLASRMIAIVDAFDSMTTDQVYRPARSRDGAMAELLEQSGTQFDPQLVRQFVTALSERYDLLSEQVTRRWLGDLCHAPDDLPWTFEPPGSGDQGPNAASSLLAERRVGTTPSSPTERFERKLIDAMHDGVVFVDPQARILRWNAGAERLTGVTERAALGRAFVPCLLDFCAIDGRRLEDEECPIRRALESSGQVRQRVLLLGRNTSHVAVDLHVAPVLNSDGSLQGATVLLYDAQPEVSLEERCEALHEEATKDPLTKVANRAEFDRMQALFIEAHQQAGLPCSLIMTDIDHFKSINDTFGHQAGDDAIITVANLLRSMCRAGDLVARYGGEEFAVLCADCSNADAARRADEIRAQLASMSHPRLSGRQITASFGVTEYQPGDTCETMLRRADRALLQAKELGRNRVVQLGNGMVENKPKRRWWWGASNSQIPLVDAQLITPVPIDLAVEKLRGFVADHKAVILKTKENRVDMEISSASLPSRRSERGVLFLLNLEFHEQRVNRTNTSGLAKGEYLSTVIRATVLPKKESSRRLIDCESRARLIFESLRSYLMARLMTEDEGAEVFGVGVAAD